MKDPKGKDSKDTNDNTITNTFKRYSNIVVIVLLVLVVVIIFIVRTSVSIATKNMQLQQELETSRDNINTNNINDISRTNKKTKDVEADQETTSLYSAEHTQWKNHIHNISQHTQPWMLLREVNGLKNEDVVMVVASTGKNHGAYFRDRIVPSTRTWMKLLANVFVIVEDSHEVRFNLRHCIPREYESYTTLTCPHEATYLLSRKCLETYYVADGICCKVDDAINFIANENTELFKHVKYLLQSDDDTFWRVDQLLRWLAAVDKALTEYGIAKTIPLIGNAAITPSPSKLAEEGGVWHVEGCKEIKTLGWYQPFMMNRVALERVRKSTKVYGITETCKNFDVSQDVGVGVFAWIHRLHHIYIPGLEINPLHKGEVIFKANEMAVHGIRHTDEDDCEGKKWPKDYKYNQQMITGCGTIEKPGPFHNPTESSDMYDAWRWFSKHGSDVVFGENGVNDWADVVKPSTGEVMSLPYIYPLKGYNTTRHFKDYDVINDWQSFSLSDCKQKGKINNRARARRLRHQ